MPFDREATAKPSALTASAQISSRDVEKLVEKTVEILENAWHP
jgi:hypothetical protein